MSTSHHYTLKVECPGRTGLVAAITTFLANRDFFIVEMKQFDDEVSGRFFSRLEFTTHTPLDLDLIADEFNREVADALEMNAQWRSAKAPMKTLILVSQHDHCLMELLYQQKRGELNIEVTGILSNHPDLEPVANFYGLDFELLPTLETKLETKAAREKRILQAFKETGSELVILARYMQILSPELCSALAGQCINIHHSFLPGFKGARPYFQAYDRGVKQIGATAHYVTSDLDEGPIIEQEVGRVDHSFGPDDLRDMGRNMENLALSKAVRAHTEQRVFVNGLKTVVLS
ncbi:MULTISPECIES: formyltetrahydrofolate deformylase [unclassified Marinobacterium]|uniref:formyltetrahydrofolate deformylase n=1 Tax=unclassified Marinobacterium TaxID=2644139 RepID=UPI0015698DC6|nr:Formyltetrahydrofolate deformylase [Marinobacterium sp. xm-g-48]NRP15520.1 Formyltetrahydrofolate deformylase [Marinobacterium sp. xm-a-152]NRP27786.1 Formyltetrahydrofolate deformylase [Marinobacterium sp. xm-d-420]NRP47149.1 Formyltetrahydrofolate deformylase [Marinobacterium sp. xm-d-543]NRP57363.1 Formyltetrahydrofolate deformylase [Marinobacterium sp. xm-d-510]NRP60003.1 Formyltetrahydrofolate deformylase [Marinobacterium sp. xm-d-564]NRP83248.1 Formyltetrahydrofolate deformylase [Mar